MLTVASQQISAQATTGSLRGTVNDPTGGLVPGATVVAKNEATGVSLPTTTTNDSGFFTITNLLPGTYEVIVTTTSGFKTSTSTNVQVRLGQDTDIRVELQVGSSQEIVTVVGSSEEVAQTNSEISSSFDSRKVAELPSNAGGGIDTLALLAPGVTPGFGNVNSNGTTLSVNGNRARSNNFTIDGTDNNDLSVGGPSFFVSNADSVQEFQIVTNNFSAQYGRNQGAIVNIVTKSGTNQFSGTAFLYHRNSSLLDAQTNLERRDPGRSKRDKFISNVYGGTFGGPIVKNRAFFFGSYQGIRQRENFTSRGAAPSIMASELPRLSAAFPNNAAIQALVRQSTFALSNFGNVRPRTDLPASDVFSRVCISLTPATNCQTVAGGNTSGFFATALPEREFPLPYKQEEFSIRGDVNLTPKDNISARYLFQDSNTGNALGGVNGFTGDLPARSQNLSGFYTRQFSSNIVNNFQATFQRLGVRFGGGCTDALTGCIIDPFMIGEAFTNIQFGGLRAAGTPLQTIGSATNLPQGRRVDVFQFSDKVSWNIGNHSLTFGADLRYLDNSVPFLPNINGVFRFNTVASLINNQPSSVTLASGEPIIDYKQFDRFFFFQDDFRIRPNFTLNLGVRYEYSGQPVNQLNKLTVERESDPAKAFFLQSLPLEARTVPSIPADKNNIAPRLGFSYSPDVKGGGFFGALFGENSATVFRGGFSMAYDPAFYNILLNISGSAPTVFLDTITGTTANPAPALPNNPIGSAVRTAGASRLRRNAFDPRFLTQTIVGSDFHSPYSLQFSFGLQRQINNSNVVEVRYVGNRGKDLFQTVNRNPNYANLYNGFVADGIAFPSFRNLLGDAPAPQVCVDNPATPTNEGACNGRLTAGRGLIRSRENTANSQYDSLQSRYNGRFLDKNLIFGASYTFSKALDNASEIFAFGENAIAQNPFDIEKGEKSFSGFDRRHAFSMNFIYEVPYYKSQKGFLGKLLGGFQINGTYNLASGRRYTPSQFLNTFIPTYQDVGFGNNFFGFDNLRPFLGNPNANIRLVGITSIDAIFAGYTTVASPTGYYLLNDLNTFDANGNSILTPTTPNDVRFIFNGPGAALRFGTPFGNVPRNSALGPTLNQMNLGIFKTTNVTEKVKIQFRAEAFNVLNRPNSGFGVAAGESIPDIFIEDAGLFFADKGEIPLSSRRVQLGLRIIF